MILETRASKPQAAFVNSTAPFPAFVGGFGSGKTHALILRCMAKLIGDGRDLAYYMPTYGLVRDICYPRFREMLSNAGIAFRLNQQGNYIEAMGKRILFRTLDNPDRIVGYEVSDSFVDELDVLPLEKARRAWEQIIARNRQKKSQGTNTVAVGTTPEGFRFVYERWKKNPAPSYELITAPTASNARHLPPDYIERLHETYSPQLLAAYLRGEFVNLNSGTVYASYDRIACRSAETVQEGEAIFVGCDFNVTKQAATVYVQRSGVWHAVDEFVDMYDTPNMIELIMGRYGDHKIYMYPDASGRGRATNNASVSDISLLEQAGFIIRARSVNPRVRDRIMAYNRALERGLVKVNDNACPRTAECLEQQAYKNGEPDKTSGFDHQNDATTYPIAYEMPIVKPVAKVDFAFAM
jgi:PBSX family phage terminase large subunit